MFTRKGENHLCDKSLNELETILSPNFLRVHRSTIVNQNFILEARWFFKGRYLITLRDEEGTNIRSGATYYDSVKIALGLT